MSRYLVDAVGIAALAAAFTVLATAATTPAPFFGVFVVAVIVRGAMDWRPLRTRLRWWRPFEYEANRLSRRGRVLRRAVMDHGPRLEQAMSWERDVWALVERHHRDKGVALHRRHGDIQADISDYDLQHQILRRCELLEKLVIGDPV